jgi:hypothetical protein
MAAFACNQENRTKRLRAQRSPSLRLSGICLHDTGKRVCQDETFLVQVHINVIFGFIGDRRDIDPKIMEIPAKYLGLWPTVKALTDPTDMVAWYSEIQVTGQHFGWEAAENPLLWSCTFYSSQ